MVDSWWRWLRWLRKISHLLYCFVLLPALGPFYIKNLYSCIQCYFLYQSSQDLEVSLLYTKKKLIFVIYLLFFFSVFWAPTGHPGAPFTIKLCNLAYNNIFDSQSFWESEVSWIYTQKIAHSGLFFKLFFVLFWATTGQPAIYTQSLYSSIQ